MRSHPDPRLLRPTGWRVRAPHRGTAEIEVYAGTLHGWCPPDSAVYHEAQAERAWSRLLALFETALA